jgi:hypothetical protein
MLLSPLRSALASAVRSPLEAGRRAAAQIGVQPLRAISPANQMPNITTSYTTTAGLGFATRQQHWIGSGDCSEIRLLLNNSVVSTGGMDNSATVHTLSDVFLESDALGFSVRVTFSGQNSITIAQGAYDIVSDPVLPSAFGLSKFTRGEKYWIRSQGSQSLGGRLPGVRQRQTLYGTSAGQVGTFSCSNISGAGPLVLSGNNIFVSTHYTINLLGKFVSGDPLTIGGAGDSIFQGSGDSGNFGVGYFSRALFAGSGPHEYLGGLNFGMTGAYIQLWQAAPAALMAHVKYCSAFTEEMGTNNFDGTANYTPSQLDQAFAWFVGAWSAIRANKVEHPSRTFKIVRTTLLPRTTSNASGDDTPESQTVFGPKWDIGGTVDAFHQRLFSDHLGNDIDVICELHNESRNDPSGPTVQNYWKWKLGKSSSGDGTHPSPAMHAALSVKLRSVLDSIS